jgi:endonuclease-3
MKVDIDSIYSILKTEFELHPMPVVDLIRVQKGSAYKILVATILSARTKDDVTSVVAGRLFKIAPNLETLDLLSEDELQPLIYPVGFYKNKAKYLNKLPTVVNKLFNGKIPDSVEELCELPGVGRKTANLVVALAFNKPAICVDIHVHRINNRLGYTKTKTPLETEMRLRKILPLDYWITINAYMVSFGQFTCRPISPFCSRCPIKDYCNRNDVKKSR